MAKAKTVAKPKTGAKSTPFEARMEELKAELAGMEAVKTDMATAKILRNLKGALVLTIADKGDTSQPKELAEEVKTAKAAVRTAYNKLFPKKPTDAQGDDKRPLTKEASKAAMMAVLEDGELHKTTDVKNASGRSGVTAGDYFRELVKEGKIIPGKKGENWGLCRKA